MNSLIGLSFALAGLAVVVWLLLRDRPRDPDDPSDEGPAYDPSDEAGA